MFFCGQVLILQFKTVDFVLLLDLFDFGFEVGSLVLLQVLFILESLVLGLDIALDLRNVLLSFSLSIFLEVFEELSVML